MNKKQKKMLARIIIAAVLTDRFAFRYRLRDIPRLYLLSCAVYLVIGYDIVKKAFKGIHKMIRYFDENFLDGQLQRSVHLRWQFMK